MKHLLALGGGVDSSTLALVDAHRDRAAKWLKISRESLDHAFPPCADWVFSDPGAEFAATYDNIARLEAEANAVGKRLVTVRRQGETIQDWLLRLGTVPLLPGGAHICSLKFKGEVLQAWAKSEFDGEDVTWAVGIAANEERRVKRFTPAPDSNQSFIYPLRTLGLSRPRCEELLREWGWGEVRKSSCMFCPFMQPEEIQSVLRDPQARELAHAIESQFETTSPRKHAAWIDAGRPTNKAGRAPKGMWRRDSWRDGARLFAKKVEGRRLSLQEWEIYMEEGALALVEHGGQLRLLELPTDTLP